mmetsp:Transcript_11682/g.24129  ORF Transcript_11682/g.24129 Transcript_11682/m.24129 type:complete len:201 (+) Transcript_11682:378-980(+)
MCVHFVLTGHEHACVSTRVGAAVGNVFPHQHHLFSRVRVRRSHLAVLMLAKQMLPLCGAPINRPIDQWTCSVEDLASVASRLAAQGVFKKPIDKRDKHEVAFPGCLFLKAAPRKQLIENQILAWQGRVVFPRRKHHGMMTLGKLSFLTQMRRLAEVCEVSWSAWKQSSDPSLQRLLDVQRQILAERSSGKIFGQMPKKRA